MNTYFFSFAIPFEVPSQNVTNAQHWSKRAKEAKKAKNLIWHYAGSATKANEKRNLHLLCYRKRRCDDIANLIGGAKGLVDAIVQNRLLVDDSDEWASITYSQDVLSNLPANYELRFGRQPVTVITLSHELVLHPICDKKEQEPLTWKK